MMKSPPFKFCLPPLSEILTLAFGCSYQKILLFLIFLFKNSFVAILIPFATTEIVATDWRTTSTPVGIEADLLPFPLANIISSYYAFFHISVVFIWTFKSLSHTQKTMGFGSTIIRDALQPLLQGQTVIDTAWGYCYWTQGVMSHETGPRQSNLVRDIPQNYHRFVSFD